MRTLVIAGTLVPGWLAKVVYAPMADALGAQVTVLPGLGLGHTSAAVDALAEMMDGWVGPTDLVGHSQGGLAAAVLAARYPSRVGRVVTLGAPLHGSPWCRTSVPVTAVRCMSPGARLLGELRPNGEMLNVVGDRDVLVPAGQGLLDGAKHRRFALGHVGLVLSPAVMVAVAEFLAAPGLAVAA